jgi:hypothetical protein
MWPTDGVLTSPAPRAAAPEEKIMRYAIVSLLGIALTATTVAVAQDGNAHGPPKTSIISAQQTPATPTIILSKAFQPATELASMIK